jgi:hypothetical protein
VSDTVDDVIGRKVSGFFGKAGDAVLRAPEKLASPLAAEIGRREDRDRRSLERRYAEERGRLATFIAGQQTRLAQQTKSLGAVSPTLPGRVSDQAARVAAYLQSKLPERPGSPSVTPQFDKPKASPTEQAKWLRLQRAATDPISLLDDLENGRLQRDTVDTVKTLYPGVFAQVRDVAQTEAMSLSRPLKYADKLQLGMLFDFPADRSMTPQFVAAQQAAYQSPAGPAGGGKKGAPAIKAPKRPVNLSASYATESGAIEAGGEKA